MTNKSNQTLQEHLALNNYCFDALGANPGQIHRFDRLGKKKNGWLIKYISENSEFIAAAYGDWAADEKHEYRSWENQRLKKGQKAELNKKIKELHQISEQEKAKAQEIAAQKALEIWSSCDVTGETGYMRRKLIDKLYGDVRIEGDDLVIPLRDIHGKMWSLQHIKPDGFKKYFPDGKIQNHFITIGSLKGNNEVIVCEGYATGVSIHKATGKTVVCAMDCGNLVKVAKDLISPGRTILIAGDDDFRNEKNVGRLKASEAAKAVNGNAIFPVFASPEKRGTDFNDLEAIEGLDAVKACFPEEVYESQEYFRSLGYKNSVYYFYVHDNNDISSLTFSRNIQMFELAPEEYWAALYPSPKGINWQTAISNLIRASRAIGPFNSKRIRGTGVWRDGTEIVINTGKNLA